MSIFGFSTSPQCAGLLVQPHEDLKPRHDTAFLCRCLAYMMPACEHCQQVGATKEWLFSHVLTQGRMMRLGFSSLERFTADYKRKVNNARQKAWRDKTTRCRLAEELLSGDEKVQVAVVLSNEAGKIGQIMTQVLL